MFWIYFVSSCLISTALGQTEEFKLPDSISIPPELQQRLNDSEVKQVQEKYLNQFKTKCEENGHPEAFDNAKNAVQSLMACATSLVDTNVLQEEIENAKPNGKVDEVFKKYCDKTPQFRECFRNATETIKPCFSPEEQKNFKVLYNVTDQLTDFVCYKDGDRIALFIAEGGQECFQENQEELRQCVNQTIDAQTQKDLKNISVNSSFTLEFKEKQCNQMTDIQKCIVGVLDGCAKSTSANIVDSLFNFIRTATPCKNFKIKEATNTKTVVKSGKGGLGGSANGLTITSSTVFMALAAVLLV